MALSVQGCVRVAEPLPLAHRGRAFRKQARVGAPQLGQLTSRAHRVRDVVVVRLLDKDLGLRFAAALDVVLLHSSAPYPRALKAGGSRSGRYGSGQQIALSLQRFDRYSRLRALLPLMADAHEFA